jgi:hypothetical protein
MAYRAAPRLVWGQYYRTYVLAINNYNYRSLYPSDATAPVALPTGATNCYSGLQCEALAISSILRANFGVNTASVSVVQGGQTIGATSSVNGEQYFCVLNYPVTVSATYPGPVTVSRTNPNPGAGACRGVNQYCDLGNFFRTVTPLWDCWADTMMGKLENSSYPSNGLQWFVYYQGQSNQVVYPSGSLSYITPLPLSVSSFQIPAVSSSLFTLRIQEGNCGGTVPPQLTTCVFQDFNLTGGTSDLNSALTTPVLGRVLTAFDLFYLPSNVRVELLSSPGMQTFRDVPNQGGAPRCYCVLPINLHARISENAACWKSPVTDCRALLRPTDAEDCELCDFLSILRFDLRGLPSLTTNGWLRTSSATPNEVPLFTASATFSNLPGFQRTAGSVAQGGTPFTYGSNQPSATYGTSTKLSVVQRDQPLQDGFLFTIAVPAGVSSVRVQWASSIYNPQNSADPGARISVVGSQSGTVLASFNIGAGAPGTFAAGQTPNLNVQSGETLTIQFQGQGGKTESTPLLNALSVIGRQFSFSDVRELRQIGNVYQNITVLRSCKCDTPQQYSLTIIDNSQASKEMTTSCCNKDCVFPEPFTRILCLDLADSAQVLAQNCTAGQHPYPSSLRVYNATNPVGGPTPIVYSNMNPSLPDTSVWNPTYGSDNYASTTYGGCGYTVRNRLQVQISTTNVGATPFRTIARQGGYNGCLVHNQTCNYHTGLCTGQSPDVTLSNADKKRSEILLSPVPTYQGNYWNGNSWYTVLCLPYNVRVSEYSLAKVKKEEEKAHRSHVFKRLSLLTAREPELAEISSRSLPRSRSTWSAKDTTTSLLSCPPFTLVTRCSCLTLLLIGTGALFVFDLFFLFPHFNQKKKKRYPGIGFDITLRDANNVQFRGKRSKLFLPNCTFDRWAWSSATCLDCGYRQNYFSVLTVPGINVQTVELPYNDRPLQYPDTRQYPVVIQTADCSVGTACQTNIYETFSRINVKSARGAPGRIYFLCVALLLVFASISFFFFLTHKSQIKATLSTACTPSLW